MPTHEYECDQCGEFEMVRLIGERVSTGSCPECGKEAPKQWKNTPPRPVTFKEGFNQQLGQYVRSKRHEKDVCKEIFDRSGGKVQPEWH